MHVSSTKKYPKNTPAVNVYYTWLQDITKQDMPVLPILLSSCWCGVFDYETRFSL